MSDLLDLSFVCPRCGGSEFGSVRLDDYHWQRICRTSGCGFAWLDDQDSLYFQELPMPANAAPAGYYIPSEKLLAEVGWRFTYHPPAPDQIERYALIRRLALEYAKTLLRICPESRELSLALTHLDQVVMFADAAIARHEARHAEPSSTR